MVTWIEHLRIAENLLSRIKSLEVEPFSLDNIAPDSGIPDEKWEKFDLHGDHPARGFVRPAGEAGLERAGLVNEFTNLTFKM